MSLRRLLEWMLLLCGVAVCARAQAPVPSTASAALVEMAGRAGVIFVGTVLTVDRQDARGYVDVRFQVEDGIAGCRTGSVYGLHEWAGLWSGAPRFSAGQRLLVLLHGRGSSGLSSPVDGMAGVIPIGGAGLPATPAARDDGVAAEQVANLGWVAARVLRESATVRAAGGVHAEGLSALQPSGWAGPVKGLAAAPETLGVVAGVLKGAVRDAGR